MLAISLPVGIVLPLDAATCFRVFRALSSLPLSTSNLALSGNHYMTNAHNQHSKYRLSVRHLNMSLVSSNSLKHCYIHTYTAGGSKDNKRKSGES